VFSSFRVIALLLAAIGVYGVISFNVTRRLTELGIRAALGATRARLARLVLTGTTAIALGGVGVGVAISLIAARRLDALLFQTSATDPASLVGAVVLLLLVALVASLGPLRIAARADPVGCSKRSKSPWLIR
jgi:putative ABC transport system permease protein